MGGDPMTHIACPYLGTRCATGDHLTEDEYVNHMENRHGILTDPLTVAPNIEPHPRGKLRYDKERKMIVGSGEAER